MSRLDKWGIVATIKAPTDSILNFVAWHLDQGAARLLIYLDDDAPGAQARLQSHPAVSVLRTDNAHWHQRLGRVPAKHQLRQGRNAEHAYGLAHDIDWLAHIDVDEFLICEGGSIAQDLSRLDTTVRVARARPQEVLSQPVPKPGGTGIDRRYDTLCKAWLPAQKRGIVPEAYPNYGKYFRAGFVSHVAGKIFVRTGQPNLGFRIHDVFDQGTRVPSQDMPRIALIHDHASDWDQWLAHYRYRHAKGSYRADLKGALAPERGGLTPHQLLAEIENTAGEEGLRRFFMEMCTATPHLVESLDRHDALQRYAMNLGDVRHAYFPS